MTKHLVIAVLAALMLPATALADPVSEGDRLSAADICQTQRGAMGVAQFKLAYGTNHDRSNAYGKCVSRQTRAMHAARHAAVQQCQAERRDPSFAQTHGGKTFEQFYGGGKKNALQNCIAQKTQTAQQQQTERGINAAKACKAQRTAMGAADFGLLYGTNANRRNAFGKCVSRLESESTAHEQNAAQQCRAEQADPTFPAAHGGKTFGEFYGRNANDSDAFGNCVSGKAKAAAAERQQAVINAAKMCKAERAANPTAFRNTYGTNANKSNAFGRCVAQHAKD